MVLKAIAAMAANRVIGSNGRMPWHLPDDLRWFKRITLDHPIIMGRTTWESLGRPLPRRLNIVVSRSLAPAEAVGATIARSPEEAVEIAARESDTAFVIGGAEIYRQLLDRCDELYLTCLREAFPGDTEFPPLEDTFDGFEVVAESPDFEIRRYHRVAPDPSRIGD